jgi:sterol desaturase/sphingolipid hydroxylase (fatty acid hydroxylase superfamily)
MQLVRALVAFVLLSALFLPLERRWPVQRGRPWFRPGYRTDVAHFFFTGLLSGVAIVVTAVPVLLIGQAVRPDGLQEAVRAQPFWLELAEKILLVQLASYWIHRAEHTLPWLWRFHRVHHSSPRLDWLASTHLHPVDQGVTIAGAFAIPLLLGFDVSAFGAVVGVFQLHAIAQHANWRLGFGPLRSAVSGPSFHHWHHSNDPGARDRNFAGLFPWIDRLFGTYHDPPGTWPATYGIDGPMPAGYLRQLAAPFRRSPLAGAAPTAEGVPVPS